MVRRNAATAMRLAIVYIPKDDEGWPEILKSTQDELLRLTQDTDTSVHRDAALLLGSAIYYIPDKDIAFKDLQRLASNDHHPFVRNGAAIGLGLAIPGLPDRETACHIIHNLSKERDGDVREGAAIALGLSFQYFIDKARASEDIFRLAHDTNPRVRWMATDALGLSFCQLPDRDRAWRELVERTGDSFLGVKRYAIDALKSSFSYATDKNQAWNVLLRLTSDSDEIIRRDAAYSLKHVVSHITEMDGPWQNLIDLTRHEDFFVRGAAIDALGSAFPRTTDKEQSWSDIEHLAKNSDSIVRGGTASILGSIFSLVLDRNLAWTALEQLARDKNNHVRMNAYHSLGRASVLKATEAEKEEGIKGELENAVDYFGLASRENPKYNPAHFCYPFYRSYYNIIFQEADNEVQTFIAEARDAVGRSSSKEELLGIIENLSNALNEAQRLKNRPLGEIADNLKIQRSYCEEAAKLMDSIEGKVPSVIKLFRKGNVIVDNRIKDLIAEIQDNARKIFEITSKSGSNYKVLGDNINETAKLLSAKDLARTDQCSYSIISQIENALQRSL